jgi:Kef-type K+ transport system membrane component KefB
MSVESLAIRALFAIAVILMSSFLGGRVARRLGQPEVIGQLFAGIALGPSVLGQLPGHLGHLLFPSSIMPALTTVSQLALVLFLFTVGYELDLGLLRHRVGAVPVIAIPTLAVPMLLGAGSTVAFASWYRRIGTADPRDVAFVLFMAVAFAITAVPVLARIIDEYRLGGTVPGVVSMAVAGVGDAVGWLVLALALLAAGGSGQRSWPVNAALLVGYLVVMVWIVRPVLRGWAARRPASFGSMWPLVAGIVLVSAWVTGELGLHVVIGALLAGLMMPRPAAGTARPELMATARQAGALLLPVFFAISGLSVDIGAIRWRDAALLVVACLIASVGKLGAGLLAARATGLSWHDSGMIGLLLNTRGLTEIVALNAGLSAGIIGSRLYTVLVLMALLTTVGTGPLLSVFFLRGRPAEDTADAQAEAVR